MVVLISMCKMHVLVFSPKPTSAVTKGSLFGMLYTGLLVEVDNYNKCLLRAHCCTLAGASAASC